MALAIERLTEVSSSSRRDASSVAKSAPENVFQLNTSATFESDEINISAFETNEAYFHPIEEAALQSIILEKKLRHIEPILTKAKQTKDDLEKAQEALQYALDLPLPHRSEKIMMFKAGEHVEDKTYHPDRKKYKKTQIAEKRGLLKAVKSLHTKYTTIIEKQNLVHEHQDSHEKLHHAYKTIDVRLQERIDSHPNQNTTQAFIEILRNTADGKTTPIIIDRMLRLMKIHGQYDQIETIEPHIRDFAARSLTRLKPTSQKSEQRIQKHVDTMLALHVQKYLQLVLLVEGRTDSWKVWQEKAASIQTSDITHAIVNDVFDIYRLIGAHMNPTYRPNYITHISSPWESPLIKKGGILESTEESKATRYQNSKGTFIGHDQVRGRMLIIASPGVPANVLDSFDLPIGRYVDPRANMAIQAIKEDKFYAKNTAEHLIAELRSIPVVPRPKSHARHQEQNIELSTQNPETVVNPPPTPKPVEHTPIKAEPTVISLGQLPRRETIYVSPLRKFFE
jgi:hypothetical protein